MKVKRTTTTTGSFVPFPGGSEIRCTLAASEWDGLNRVLLVLVQDLAHALLQTEQANELRVGRVGDEMHLWGWRFGWRNLEKSK